MTRKQCMVPPKGWRCTRMAGHEGPCAAVSDSNDPPVCEACEDEYSLRDGMEVSRYCDPCAQERVAVAEDVINTVRIGLRHIASLAANRSGFRVYDSKNEAEVLSVANHLLEKLSRTNLVE
jgi:hypothetical protein